MESIKIKKAQAKSIVSATFPEYKGRKFKVEFATQVTFYNTNWAGGSKNDYAAIGANGHTARLTVSAPWTNVVEGKTIDLPSHVLIVKHTFFCGQDMGITIYANPVHLPKWIESGK